MEWSNYLAFGTFTQERAFNLCTYNIFARSLGSSCIPWSMSISAPYKGIKVHRINKFDIIAN